MSHATLLFSFFKFLFLITTQLFPFQLKTLPLFILGSMIYKTIIIHPTFSLHVLLFFSPSSFLSQITVTLLSALSFPFLLFFSPLFHTLPLQFQPLLSIFYSSHPISFSTNFLWLLLHLWEDCDSWLLLLDFQAEHAKMVPMHSKHINAWANTWMDWSCLGTHGPNVGLN